MRGITEPELEELGQRRLTILKFTAAWCGSCRAIAPLMEELVVRYPEIEFWEVDQDRFPVVGLGYRVMSLPTIIALQSGIEQGRVTRPDKALIRALVEQLAAS